MPIFTVPDELSGERADRIVAIQCELARAKARSLIEGGFVEVDGEEVRPASKLSSGNRVVVTIEESPVVVAPDAHVEFDVVHVDESLIVVDKPAGLVVHPGAGRPNQTLVNGLIARYPELIDLGEDHRWGIVHRLDRDTSGLLLVARTADAHTSLQRELRERNVRREYQALVVGHLDSTTGTIDAPIGRDPAFPLRMALRRDGREARTHYRRAAEWLEPARSMLDVRLETGRTHQIRVHLSSIDHPILGDVTYGVTGVPGDPGRTFLHAVLLRFLHPETGTELKITSDLPDDLVGALVQLGDPSADNR